MTSTNLLMAVIAVSFLIAAVVLAEATHRYKVRKRIEYSEHLLNRRDNFPVGDLDVDRSE